MMDSIESENRRPMRPITGATAPLGGSFKGLTEYSIFDGFGSTGPQKMGASGFLEVTCTSVGLAICVAVGTDPCTFHTTGVAAGYTHVIAFRDATMIKLKGNGGQPADGSFRVTFFESLNS